MDEIALEKLTEMLIKEDFENRNRDVNKYLFTKKDLLQFTIKVVKTIIDSEKV